MSEVVITELRDFLYRLDGVESSGNNAEGFPQYKACCPAHDDRRASLSVSENSKGQLLVCCHAGCSPDAIVKSMGLTLKDLNPVKKEKPKIKRDEAEFVYQCDESGKPVFVKVKVRYSDGSKEFFWKHKEAGRWVWNQNGFNDPVLLYGWESIGDNEQVFIVEGEKDVDTMLRLGYPCITFPNGAGQTKYDKRYDKLFRGKDVYAVPDNDDAGKKYIEFLKTNILPISNKFCVLNLKTVWEDMPNKADITDLVNSKGEEAAVKILLDLIEQNDKEKTSVVKAAYETIGELSAIIDAVRQEHPEDEREYSDQMMGRLYAHVFGHELRYNVTAKEWYKYNGRFWEMDTGGMIAAQKAKQLTDALLIYSTQTNTRDFIKFAVRYGQLAKRKIMVEDARSEMFISNSDLDKNGNYFNCQNGTFDLSTFELLPHNPEHLISKMSNVYYDYQARSPDWIKFIREVMVQRESLIIYLMKLCGITLTTETYMEMLWLLYGPTTRNGKSTLTETLAYMHGNSAGYALMMAPETLAQRKTKDTRQASGDIARLNGCRFLNASEPPKRMLFDAALIKLLTGRDTVVARHLMEREFEFTPQFKLLINTNYLPRIQDDTLFESGRIVVIPFDRHFSSEEQDEGLKDRLRKPENISGIFNWCLEGLRLFRETGLTPPDELKEATAAYREQSDKIASFLSECMERTGKNSAAGSVYQKFAAWCEEAGYGTESKRSFFEELQNKGIFAERGMVNGQQVRNIIIGYEIIEEQETLLP